MIVGRVGDGRLALDGGPPLPERAGRGCRRPALGHRLRLYAEVLDRPARAAAPAGRRWSSIGIDSWGVDYGLLDDAGALLGDPYHYRDDARPRPRWSGPRASIPRRRSTRATASSTCRSTRCYQLDGRPRRRRRSRRARTMLLIPDLLGVLADRRARRRADQRVDDRPARPDDRATGTRTSSTELGLAARSCSAARASPGERRSGPSAGDVAARDGRSPRARPSRSSGRTTPRRRSSAVPAEDAAVRVHLVRDVVARRRRARRADPRRGRAGAAELHERGRRRRHGSATSAT